MKRLKSIILLLFFFSCEKEAEINYLLVQTGEVADISEKGAAFHAKIINPGNLTMEEYGFVWGESKNVAYSSSQKVILRDKPGQDTFSSFISTTLQADEKYYVRAFVKSSSEITYGPAVSFVSLGSGAPEIKSFYPRQGNLGDSLIISGSKFSYLLTSNTVTFREHSSQILYATQDTLIVKVPVALKEAKAALSVSIDNNQVMAEEEFTLLAPEITDFYPKQGNILDTLRIVGKNLGLKNPPQYPNDFRSKITAGDMPVEVLYSSPDTLLGRIPRGLALEHTVVSIINHNGLQEQVAEKFSLKAPHIADFYPKEANPNDVLTIVGENFTVLPRAVKSSKVSIGGISANILRITPDTAVVRVPQHLSTEAAEVQLSNHNGLMHTAEEQFRLRAFQVSNFYPKEGSPGVIMTIEGSGLSANPQSLEVWIGDQKANIWAIHDSHLEVEVPLSLVTRSNTVSVKMNNFTWESSDKFTVAPIVLGDFSPKGIWTGQEITITGENFHPQADKNLVRIGSLQASVTQASSTELKVLVPLQETAESPYPLRNVAVSVEVLNDEKIFSEELIIEDDWFRISDFPGKPTGNRGSGYYSFKSFIVGDKAYIGLNNSSQFWSFDPATGQWQQKADFPGTFPRSGGFGFVLNDKIYFGAEKYYNGMKDWWEYNTATNSWNRKNNIPEEDQDKVVVSFVCSSGTEGYIGMKKMSEFYPKLYKYNTEADLWEHSVDFPSFDLQGGYIIEHGAIMDRELYLWINPIEYHYVLQVHVYSFETHSWRRIADYPSTANDTYQSLFFQYANEMYLRTNVSEHFYKYQKLTDSWLLFPMDIQVSTNSGISFSMESKIYVGLGEKNFIWEYDPNR